MFVFLHVFTNPVDENKLFCIKTIIKTITFSPKKSDIFLTLWIDVLGPNTVAV